MFVAVTIIVTIIVALFGARMAQAEADFRRRYRISKGIPVSPYVPFMRPGEKEPRARELWKHQDEPEVEYARRKVIRRAYIMWAVAAIGMVAIGLALARSS